MTPNRVIAKRRFERAQRLPVLAEQRVEQPPAGGIGEGLEHRVHASAL